MLAGVPDRGRHIVGGTGGGVEMSVSFGRRRRSQRNDSGDQGRLAQLLRGRHHWRGVVLFITLPAIALGTATFAGAYGLSRLSGPVAPPCVPQVVAAPARSSFGVGVFNASSSDGLAAGVAKQLTTRGFQVTSVANQSDLSSSAPVEIAYGAKGIDNAVLLAQQVPGAELHNDGRLGTGVVVIIHDGFTGLAPAPAPIPPKPAQIDVNVYNTTFRSGLATTVADELAGRGFGTDKVGNDPRNAFLPDASAVIRYGEKGELAAKVVAQQVPDATLMRVDRSSAAVDLVLGNRYTALTPLDQVPPAPPPPPKPPTTMTRPCGVS